MQRILNFIKNLSLKDIFYLLVIFGLVFILFNTYKDNKNKEMINKNNITALTDSISYYKSKNGELIATKTLFETNIKELENLNENLYTEIKDLKAKNKILLGVHMNGTIENPTNDTVYIVETIKSPFKYDFNFNNKWRDLEGMITYNNDSLTLNFNKDVVRFDYTIGLDNKNNIYIKSDNPYVSYNEISGFVIPEKPKSKFVIGPSITYGVDMGNFKPSLNVGFSLTYKFFEF
jgi:hypothetical protein